MIFDHFETFSDAQAVTADAGSTNIIDLKVTGRKLGAGAPLALVLYVDVAADFTATNETYSIDIQTDDDVAFGSATTLGANVRTAAVLTAGSRHVFVLDPGWTFERYLRAYFDVGGTTPTITATIALQPLDTLQTDGMPANGYTITH